MDKRKVFLKLIYIAVILWSIAVIQIVVTRLYAKRVDLTQAFARKQIVVLKKETEQINLDKRNEKEGNTCVVGEIRGKLTTEEKRQMAIRLFAEYGGGMIEENTGYFTDYFVAYGYSTGLANNKKVNGKEINMNVVMTYNEKKDITKIIFGTPIINSDY